MIHLLLYLTILIKQQIIIHNYLLFNQKIEDKEQRIKQAYRDGIDSLEEYKENKLLLSKERNTLTTTLQTINQNSAAKTQIANEIHSVYDIIKDETLDNTIRATALRSIVDHMVYDKNKDTLKNIFLYII